MVLLAIINLDQKSYPQLQLCLQPQQSLLPQVSLTGSVSFPIKINYSRTRRELQKYKIEMRLKIQVLQFVSILNVEGIN